MLRIPPAYGRIRKSQFIWKKKRKQSFLLLISLTFAVVNCLLDFWEMHCFFTIVEYYFLCIDSPIFISLNLKNIWFTFAFRQWKINVFFKRIHRFILQHNVLQFHLNPNEINNTSVHWIIAKWMAWFWIDIYMLSKLVWFWWNADHIDCIQLVLNIELKTFSRST